MKRLLVLALLAAPALALAQAKKPEAPPTLRSVLLSQLKSTHSSKEWFVPANDAVAGLTPEQAAWTDGSGNHSVGQLANHLIFWNGEQLAKMTGKPVPKFNGNNDETFNAFNAANWAQTQKDLDKVLTDLEAYVASCSEADLQKHATDIAHISTHNAYHVGQMLFVRKLHGTWNPANGVK